MSIATVSGVRSTSRDPVAVPRLVDVLRAEWIKLSSLRSTWWTLGATVGLGAGLTVLLCAVNADWLASGKADESPGSFITWGMMVAQICAVVLGTLCVTSEYGTRTIQLTFTAIPSRGTVMLAKSVLVASLMLVVGTVTAVLGYLGGNYFLSRAGIGLPLEGDVLRSLYGSGLVLMAIALLSVAVGFIARHTAGTITLVLAVIMILGNMVMMVPGAFGDWLAKLMPGNAGQAISSPVPFNPELLSAWPGLAVLIAEVTVLLAIAWAMVRRRDV